MLWIIGLLPAQVKHGGVRFHIGIVGGPRALLLPSSSVPVATIVIPVKVLEPERTRVPVPILFDRVTSAADNAGKREGAAARAALAHPLVLLPEGDVRRNGLEQAPWL